MSLDAVKPKPLSHGIFVFCYSAFTDIERRQGSFNHHHKLLFSAKDHTEFKTKMAKPGQMDLELKKVMLRYRF